MEEFAVSHLGSVSGDEEDLADTALFQEPEGYYEPEKQPSFVNYTLPSVGKLRLRLVGHSPLWVRNNTYFEVGSSTHGKFRAIFYGMRGRWYRSICSNILRD